MSGHLPECPIPMLGGLPEGQPCFVCDALRACEERVMASDEPWAKASAAANMESYDEGFAAGLAAARDAVAALFPQERYPDEHAAVLAAIDALRGSGNPDTPPSAEKGEQA